MAHTRSTRGLRAAQVAAGLMIAVAVVEAPDPRMPAIFSSRHRRPKEEMKTYERTPLGDPDGAWMMSQRTRGAREKNRLAVLEKVNADLLNLTIVRQRDMQQQYKVCGCARARAPRLASVGTMLPRHGVLPAKCWLLRACLHT